MQLSKFFHAIPINNEIYAIYNSLLMDIIFVSKEEYTDIVLLRAVDIDTLKEYGIYVEDESRDEDALLIMQKEYEKLNRKIEIMYFIVSTGCNLKCKYCFEEESKHNNHSEINMSYDIAMTAAKKYVEYLERHDIEKPQVIFYGGEPLVNWDIVKSVINYISSCNSKVKFNIVTNGTLIDDEKAKYISEHDVEVGISLDGPKCINDYNRIFRVGNNSVYDTVMKRIDILKNHKCKYGLSITISQALIDSKDKVLEWLKTSGLQSIFYNLYHYGEVSDTWEDFYNEMSNYLIESYNNLSTIGIADGRLNRKIDSLLDNKIKFSDCAAVGVNQLTIKPNGDVIVCHGYVKTDKYVLGNIKDKSIEELAYSEGTNIWKNMAPIYNEECLKCDSLYICGGGCSMQSEALFGGVQNIDRAFCIHSKKSLYWLLERLYEASIEQINKKGE